MKTSIGVAFALLLASVLGGCVSDEQDPFAPPPTTNPTTKPPAPVYPETHLMNSRDAPPGYKPASGMLPCTPQAPETRQEHIVALNATCIKETLFLPGSVANQAWGQFLERVDTPGQGVFLVSLRWRDLSAAADVHNQVEAGARSWACYPIAGDTWNDHWMMAGPNTVGLIGHTSPSFKADGSTTAATLLLKLADQRNLCDYPRFHFLALTDEGRLYLHEGFPESKWRDLSFGASFCTQATPNATVHVGGQPANRVSAVATRDGLPINSPKPGDQCGPPSFQRATDADAALQAEQYLEFCGQPNEAALTNVHIRVKYTARDLTLAEYNLRTLRAC